MWYRRGRNECLRWMQCFRGLRALPALSRGISERRGPRFIVLWSGKSSGAQVLAKGRARQDDLSLCNLPAVKELVTGY